MTGSKTESETYFESFCHRNGFDIQAVPVGAGRTPDYVLRSGHSLVVIEVKEVLPSADELESERLVDQRGYGNVIHRTPGGVVRKKITDCSPQLKARTQGQHPGLLVLWERGRCAGAHTEPYNIRVAMEGFEQVLVSVPPIGSGESPAFGGMKHGGGRKTTPEANTSISAVALLCVPAPDAMLLQVFHNRHASVPLNPTLLRSTEVAHYALRDVPNRTTEWIKITT